MSTATLVDPMYDPFASPQLVGRRILILGTKATQSAPLCRALERQDARVTTAATWQQGVEYLRSGIYAELLILDIDPSTAEALQTLHLVRGYSRGVPIVVLSDHVAIETKIAVLRAGADELLARPFAVEELLVRLEVLLRSHQHCSPNISVVGDLTLFRNERWAERNGRTIVLTTREFLILDYMTRSPGGRVTRSELLANVWSLPANTTSNVIDVYISYLRNKIDQPGERPLIHTVRGVGYELRA